MILRQLPFSVAAICGTLLFVVAAHRGWPWLIGGVLLWVIAFIGAYDLLQRRHSILRNYPLIGHLRYLMESIRPEIQQYFIERDVDGRPFDRDQRSLIYERAKGISGELSFGTERDLAQNGYEYLVHSIVPVEPAAQPPRVRIGGDDCRIHHDMALLNVSSMSFGALSANAIRALNIGARNGAFSHDTGEGGLTPYHLQGGSLVWELGSGYFGTRTAEGRFDPSQFADKADNENVSCISVKLSQGAKPGVGVSCPRRKSAPRSRGSAASRKARNA